MNKHFYVVAGSSLVLLAGLTSAAVALAQDGGGDGAQAQQVRSSVRVSGEDSQVQTQIQAQVQDNAQAQDRVQVQDTAQVSGEDAQPNDNHSAASQAEEARQSGEGEHSTSTASEQSGSQGEDTGEINLDQESIGKMGLASTTPGERGLLRAAQVQNQNELKNFAAATVQGDKNIANVQLSSTTVSTEYPTHATFLGFIPLTVPARVNVSGDGAVHVSYPWYAFFLATNKNELQTQAQEAVQSALGTTTATSATAEAKLTPKEQATVLDSLISAFKSLFGGTSTATTTTTAQ